MNQVIDTQYDNNEWTGMRAHVGGRLLNSGLRSVAERFVMGDVSAIVRSEVFDNLQGDETALDVGAGSGYFSLQIAERLPRGTVHCLDGSADMLAILERIAHRRGLRGIIVPINADAAASGLPDESVDLVMSFALIHELAAPEAVIREMVRVLKPGGGIVVGDFLKKYSHRHPGAHGGFEPDEMRSLLAANGLHVVNVGTVKRWLLAIGRK